MPTMMAPMMVPWMLSRPPMITMGNTLSPTSTTPNPPPETTVQRTPARTDSVPTMAHVIEKYRSMSMPAAIAAG